MKELLEQTALMNQESFDEFIHKMVESVRKGDTPYKFDFGTYSVNIGYEKLDTGMYYAVGYRQTGKQREIVMVNGKAVEFLNHSSQLIRVGIDLQKDLAIRLVVDKDHAEEVIRRVNQIDIEQKLPVPGK